MKPHRYQIAQLLKQIYINATFFSFTIYTNTILQYIKNTNATAQ